MENTDLRISDDVLSSTDRAILSGWEKSSDELLIWRRPGFDAEGIQKYIDGVAVANPRRLEKLDNIKFHFYPEDGCLYAPDSADAETLESMNIMMGRNAFQNMFPESVARPLLDDIKERLRQDARTVFPTEEYLTMRLRTRTAAAAYKERFHLDPTPVLGYAFDCYGTEYLGSNKDIPEIDKNELNLSPQKFSRAQIKMLKPGDVSIMKRKPHRNIGIEKQQFKVWIGLFKAIV